jgi:hypothetical protein
MLDIFLSYPRLIYNLLIVQDSYKPHAYYINTWPDLEVVPIKEPRAGSKGRVYSTRRDPHNPC